MKKKWQDIVAEWPGRTDEGIGLSVKVLHQGCALVYQEGDPVMTLPGEIVPEAIEGGTFRPFGATKQLVYLPSGVLWDSGEAAGMSERGRVLGNTRVLGNIETEGKPLKERCIFQIADEVYATAEKDFAKFYGYKVNK
jgi:hypothetical protein